MCYNRQHGVSRMLLVKIKTHQNSKTCWRFFPSFHDFSWVKQFFSSSFSLSPTRYSAHSIWKSSFPLPTLHRFMSENFKAKKWLWCCVLCCKNVKCIASAPSEKSARRISFSRIFAVTFNFFFSALLVKSSFSFSFWWSSENGIEIHECEASLWCRWDDAGTVKLCALKALVVGRTIHNSRRAHEKH